MQRFLAARSARRLAVAACGLLGTLMLAAGASAGRPVSAPLGARSIAAPPADGTCDGTARLAISTRHPVQLRAVGFDASTSKLDNGSIVFYDFSYGDGTDDATTQPTAVHAYQQTGTYLARLNIVTSCNTVITSVAYHVVVRDGLPPTVAFTYPKAGETVHFGRLGLQLRGTASDPSGVHSVDIAIQITSLLPAAHASASGSPNASPSGSAHASASGCYWYDGHVSLRLRGCDTPLFFPVKLTGAHWTFRMNPRSQIPPGVYAVRIRAADRLGNQVTVFSPKLGDIEGFTLVP
jgi:hypothetical protein